MANSFLVSGRSVTGLVRSGNEDSAFFNSHLLAVADGMGGHAGGEVASALAIRVMSDLGGVIEGGEIDPDSVEDLLLNSLDAVNGEISQAVHKDIELSGMGTTLTALALYRVASSDRVAMLHIGDTRCYRLRGNTLLQMSRDHTVWQELLDQGSVTEDNLSDHPQKSILTQALMGNSEIVPVLTIHEVKSHDRFMLCSDGLCGEVSEKLIKEGLKIADREAALSFLIDASFIAGAPDNVTVIIADVSTNESTTDETFLGAVADE